MPESSRATDNARAPHGDRFRETRDIHEKVTIIKQGYGSTRPDSSPLLNSNSGSRSWVQMAATSPGTITLTSLRSSRTSTLPKTASRNLEGQSFDPSSATAHGRGHQGENYSSPRGGTDHRKSRQPSHGSQTTQERRHHDIHKYN